MPDIVIRCILTGLEVPTGLTTEDINFETLPMDIAMSVSCPFCQRTHPLDTKGRLGKGKKEARREVESRKRAAITILSLRRLSFARQDQRDHLGDVGVSCITFTLPLLSPESQLLFFCASLLWRWSLDDHSHAAAFLCGPQRVRSHPPPGRDRAEGEGRPE